MFNSAGFTTIDHRMITPQVLNALDLIHERKMKMIEDIVPIIIQSAFKGFVGIKTVRFIMPSMKEPLFICVSSSKKQLTP